MVFPAAYVFGVQEAMVSGQRTMGLPPASTMVIWSAESPSRRWVAQEIQGS